MTEMIIRSQQWTTVCAFETLVPERGVAALVGGDAVAVFRTHDDEVFALSNVDPFSGASVLSRGIVGDRGGRPTVASPIYKQVFELATGRCLDDESMRVPTYPVRVVDGVVEVGPAGGDAG
jgi:nitrite reductase (NADH) small subunit